MADGFHLFEFEIKPFDLWDGNNRDVFRAAGGDHFDPPAGFGRVAADGHGRFFGNGRHGGARIKHHFQGDLTGFADDGHLEYHDTGIKF